MCESTKVRLGLVSALVLAACSGGGGGGGGGGTNPTFGTVSGAVTRGGVGLEGVTISVEGGASTTTSASGQFTLTNVTTGARTVVVTLPAGHIAADVEGHRASVNVGANQTTTVNFALVRGVQVSAAGTSFSPAAVTVPAGGVVRWVSSSGGHTVTPDNASQAGAWTSANLTAGGSFQHTFGTAGTYGYHCIPHQAAGMTGSVTVTP